MKKIFAVAVLAIISTMSLFAQNEQREPGLYNVDGEMYTKLTYITGSTKTSGFSLGTLLDIGKQKKSYKGATSDTQCKTQTFVMVIDQEKTAIKQTYKTFDVFVKSMSPENMILVPLEVAKKNREYKEGTKINGFKTKDNKTIGFEWERISDNAFAITTELPAGEYAFVFKMAQHGVYDFDNIFDFTIVAE